MLWATVKDSNVASPVMSHIFNAMSDSGKGIHEVLEQVGTEMALADSCYAPDDEQITKLQRDFNHKRGLVEASKSKLRKDRWQASAGQSGDPPAGGGGNAVAA